MLETSTIAPFVSRRSISSAAARASSTGASKLAANEACSVAPVELAALHARRIAGERHDAVELALHLERVLDVALAHVGIGDVALHQVDEAAVEVLQLLLEGERVAAVRAVADHRDARRPAPGAR